ncbi:MAG: septation protein A [Burkholderiaceae bacterium]|nr:septation protein A [Burkholderiaceae bacterium]
MKLFFDLFPVLLFFAAYRVWDIYVATAAAIVASVAQIGWLLMRRRKVSPMQWVSLLIIVVFGGLTLVLHDETFIKWKPTILYATFVVALLVARYMMGRNLIQAMLGEQLKAPPHVWDRLNLAWCAFFAVMAATNLAVAYGFSTETWVRFKVFGTLGLTFVFVLAQAAWLGRFAEDPK